MVEIFAELDRIYDDENYRPLQWDPESATCVWTNQIPEVFVEATQAVGKSANSMA
ncbi:MAG: hypothetical protein QGF68_13355 [Nitrospinota bacterium]|nr:hypothetical protein [Nitrospinota bacterium]